MRLFQKKKRDRRKEWIGRGGGDPINGKTFQAACFIIFMKVPIRRIGYRLSLRHDVPYRRVAHAPIWFPGFKVWPALRISDVYDPVISIVVSCQVNP